MYQSVHEIVIVVVHIDIDLHPRIGSSWCDLVTGQPTTSTVASHHTYIVRMVVFTVEIRQMVG